MQPLVLPSRGDRLWWQVVRDPALAARVDVPAPGPHLIPLATLLDHLAAVEQARDQATAAAAPPAAGGVSWLGGALVVGTLVGGWLLRQGLRHPVLPAPAARPGPRWGGRPRPAASPRRRAGAA